MSEINVILEGAPNFRDLGGYPTIDGGVVKRGKLFRSEGFSRLSDNDLERLRTLAIKLVMDLRGDEERQRRPTRWCKEPAAEFLNIPVIADARNGNQNFMETLKADFSSRGVQTALRSVYRQIPQGLGAHMALIFDKLANTANLPAVIHCQAGKDRTGFASAIILHVLGVSMDTIREDYRLSARYYRDEGGESVSRVTALVEKMLDRKVPPGMLDVLSEVKSEYLDAAFTTIDEQYGSLDAYLEKCAQLDQRKISQLRSIFVEGRDPIPA